MKHEIQVMFNFLLYTDRRGNGQKTTPDKIFQTKDFSDKPPGQKPREQLRENLYRWFLPWVFCTIGLLKMGVRGVWRTFGRGGVPGYRDIWQSVTRGGGQNWPKIAWSTLWTTLRIPSLIHHVLSNQSYGHFFPPLAQPKYSLRRRVHSFMLPLQQKRRKLYF